MTTYDFNGGSWSNPADWFNVSTMKFGDGVPGAGDIAEPFTGHEIISGGGGGGADVLGFTFENGTYNVEIFDSGTVGNGGTVIAAEIGSFDSNGVLVTVAAGGVLKAVNLVGGALDVKGGTAVISGDVQPSTIEGVVTESVVTVEAGDLTIRHSLDGSLITIGDDAEATVNGVTIEGSVTADLGHIVISGPGLLAGSLSATGTDSAVTIYNDLIVGTTDIKGSVSASGGGELYFHGNLTLAFGATLQVGSGEITVEGNLSAGNGAPLIISPDGSLKVFGNLVDTGDALLLRLPKGLADVTGDLELLNAIGPGASLILGGGSSVTAGEATIESRATVDDGGRMKINGRVFGIGTIAIESGGLLYIGGADGHVGAAFTAGTGETLELKDDEQFFYAAITGFGKGDTIALDDASVTGKTFAKGVLTLSNGTTLKFAGSYRLSNFHFTESGTFTEITYQTAPRASTEAATHGTLELFGAANAIAYGGSAPTGGDLLLGTTDHAMLGFR
jgi:hypothetical protein